jgi:hypothetical protein
MDLDFETFLQEINTADDNNNDYYDRNGGIEIFENFLDRIYNRIENDTQEDFYIMSDGDDDDEFDDLLEMIEDDDTEQQADYYAIAAE